MVGGTFFSAARRLPRKSLEQKQNQIKSGEKGNGPTERVCQQVEWLGSIESLGRKKKRDEAPWDISCARLTLSFLFSISAYWIDGRHQSRAIRKHYCNTAVG